MLNVDQVKRHYIEQHGSALLNTLLTLFVRTLPASHTLHFKSLYV